MRRLLLLAVAAVVLTGCLPKGFAVRTTQQALVHPTSFAFAPDGRLFVAEKRGTIQTYDSVDDPTPDQVADLRTQVQSTQDHGLLAIEVDRQWPTRPYLYLLYSYDAPPGGTAPTWGGTADDDACFLFACTSQARVARLTVGWDLHMADLKVLVRDVCLEYVFHGGGDVRQAPDGSLYASFGEGAFPDADGIWDTRLNRCNDPVAEGGNLRAQDLRTWNDPTGLSGSVIHIDPDTGAPWPTNPLAGFPDPEARKIVAEGLRNPYRLALRPGTSELWIGDVGGTQFEEIDRLPPGAPFTNFGWPCYEGGAPQPGVPELDEPICAGLYTAPGAVTAPVYQYCHVADTEGHPCQLNGFGAGAISGLEFYTGDAYGPEYKGALFFADYTQNVIRVMKTTNGLPDPSKVEDFATDIAAAVDLRSGPNGDLFFVDIFGGTVQRLYKGAAPPIDTVRPRAFIDTPVPGSTYQVGDTITFSGHAQNAAGNPLPASSMRWDLIQLHCPSETTCHRHFVDSRTGVASGSFVAQDHEQPSHLEIALTVTDQGRTDTATVDLLRRSAAAVVPPALPTAPGVPLRPFVN